MRVILTLILLAITTVANATNITVFAAASLSDSLKEIAGAFEKESGDKVIFNFAASGPLARQIQEGAPADIFFSADEARADALAQKGLLVRETRKSLLGNQLVFVIPSDSTLTIGAPKNLASPKVKRIALGDPETVPAGTYSKAYLEKLGLWASIQPKVVPCESVRAVLAAVESGNIDAGIIYKTDAAISKHVKITFEVPRSDAPDISYPIALLKNAPHPDAAKRFLTYLESKQSMDIFVRYGFIPH